VNTIMAQSNPSRGKSGPKGVSRPQAAFPIDGPSIF
jgi:hypothetical protein